MPASTKPTVYGMRKRRVSIATNADTKRRKPSWDRSEFIACYAHIRAVCYATPLIEWRLMWLPSAVTVSRPLTLRIR